MLLHECIIHLTPVYQYSCACSQIKSFVCIIIIFVSVISQELPKDLKQRLVTGLQRAIEIVDEHDEEESSNRCSCFKDCCIPSHSNLTKDIVPPHFDLPYNIGLNLSRELLLPAMPYFLRDLWIFLELLVTVAQVVLAVISIPNSTNIAVTIVFIVLASLSALLAGFDAFLYYYELGSYKYMLKNCRKPKENDDKEQDEGKRCQCIRLSPKSKRIFNQWFEVIRTVVSELLLYPLIVFDLFDVGRNGFINQRLDFSIFLISSIYMVLSVYLARVIISMSTLRSLLKLLSKTETGPSNIRFIVRFFTHIITQIVSHLACIVAVGLKIHQENVNTQNFTASPFLWVVMFGGWVIPFIGVVIFFLTNYFWTQQYSIGLFIEMMSLIQVPNIAQSLFKSSADIEQDVSAKSQKIFKKMQFLKVKGDYHRKLENAKRITKLLHPGKIYAFLLIAFFYLILLISFFVNLLLQWDTNGNVALVDLYRGENIFIVGCIAIIIVSNIHFLILTPFLPEITLYSMSKKMMKSTS